MIKINIKTVSAKDYQGISTKRCSITDRNYSDLSSNKVGGYSHNFKVINQAKKIHTCDTPPHWINDIAKRITIALHGEEEYKRLLELQMKML